jgi:hypothetical protein
MKTNKTQRRVLAELIAATGGIVPASEWTNGAGRYTTRKATPPACGDLDIETACQLPGMSGKIARRLHKARPRVQRVIVVTDRRRANQLAAK